MSALALSLLVLSLPAQAPSGVETPAPHYLARPGAATLTAGLVVVGLGVASSTVGFVAGAAGRQADADLDDAVDDYRDDRTIDHAKDIVRLRGDGGSSAERAMRDNVNVALMVGGAATMTIGWVVAALGALALPTEEASP